MLLSLLSCSVAERADQGDQLSSHVATRDPFVFHWLRSLRLLSASWPRAAAAVAMIVTRLFMTRMASRTVKVDQPVHLLQTREFRGGESLEAVSG